MGHGEPSPDSKLTQLYMSRALLTAIDDAAAVWTGRYAPGKRPNRSDFVRRACLAYIEEVAPGIADDIKELI